MKNVEITVKMGIIKSNKKYLKKKKTLNNGDISKKCIMTRNRFVTLHNSGFGIQSD